VHRNSFTDRMMMAASILSGHAVSEQAGDRDDDAAVSFNPIRAQIVKIQGSWKTFSSTRLPDNYRLAYEYLNGGNPRIRKSVDNKLNNNGRLSNELVSEILDECEGRMDVQELSTLMSTGEALLGSGHKTLATSGKENAEYAEALRSNIDVLKDLDPTQNRDLPIEAQFNALLKITKQMMQSTQKAKESLESNCQGRSARCASVWTKPMRWRNPTS
jgi:diguanylate cyclase